MRGWIWRMSCCGFTSGTALEGVSGRKFCLGCALLYVSFDLAHPEPEEMTRCLKETWYKLRREQYRISGINMFSLGLGGRRSPASRPWQRKLGTCRCR